MQVWWLSKDEVVLSILDGLDIAGMQFHSDQGSLIETLTGITPGIIFFGPEFSQAENIPTLKTILKSNTLNHWMKITFSKSDEPETFKILSHSGSNSVYHWNPNPEFLKPLILSLIQQSQVRHFEISSHQQDLLNHANVVLWEFDVKSWRYVYVSDSVQRVLGYPPQRWYEKNFTQTLIHPEDRNRLLEFFRLSIKQSSGIHEIRCRMLGAGGRVVWFRFIISVDHEVDNDTPIVGGIALDITSEVQRFREKENAKKKELSLLEEHLNRAPIAVLQANEELSVTGWSSGAEEMFGISAETAIGNPWNKLGLIHPEDEARVVEELVPLLNGQVKYQEVWNRNIKADGSVIHVHWVNTCLWNEDGKLRSLLSMGRDLTAEHKVQEQYRKIAKMDAVVKLTSGFAHDFHNLITPILHYAEEIAGDNALPMNVRDTSRKIIKNSLRANNIIATLLNVNKPLKPNLVSIDANVFLNEIAATFETQLPENVSLKLNLSTPTFQFAGDENLLHQAVVNLVKNANQAIGETNGTIELSAALRPEDAKVVIKVADNGPGIAQELQDDVFVPFFTTKHADSGTGLGLMMAKKVSEAHKGEISFHSDSGYGTQFEITLPFLPHEEIEKNTADENADSSNSRQAHPSLQIMVVEDDPMVLKVLEDMLLALGHTVAPLGDPYKALQQLSENQEQFDLIISDQNMSNLTGIGLISNLIDKGILIPVLLMSGSVADLEEELPANSSVVGLLPKPISMESLKKALGDFLKS